MLRKSSLIALTLCVSLFLALPIITLLLVVRQTSSSRDSFGESSATFPGRRQNNLRLPAQK